LKGARQGAIPAATGYVGATVIAPAVLGVTPAAPVVFGGMLANIGVRTAIGARKGWKEERANEAEEQYKKYQEDFHSGKNDKHLDKQYERYLRLHKKGHSESLIVRTARRKGIPLPPAPQPKPKLHGETRQGGSITMNPFDTVNVPLNRR